MSEGTIADLRVVDAATLDTRYRDVLRPGERIEDRRGQLRRLPRFFYEVPSWDRALETRLTPHFSLYEFLDVDVREADAMRAFPRYVPCAVTLLAAALELFRQEVGAVVRIAANGGYRSPGHELSGHASRHSWATAANLYRIGDQYLEDRESIERYAAVARRVLPSVWVRPYGGDAGQAMDHLHLDLGYTVRVPHDAAGEEPGPDGAAAGDGA